jgi:hypothetical protein
MAKANLNGTFSATGVSESVEVSGKYNLTLWGTFVATVVLQRSFNGGSFHNVCIDANATPASYACALSLILQEPEIGVAYRLKCTAYTSGDLHFRISQ